MEKAEFENNRCNDNGECQDWPRCAQHLPGPEERTEGHENEEVPVAGIECPLAITVVEDLFRYSCPECFAVSF